MENRVDSNLSPFFCFFFPVVVTQTGLVGLVDYPDDEDEEGEDDEDEDDDLAPRKRPRLGS